MELVWLASAYALGMLARGIGLPPLVGYLVAGFVMQLVVSDPHIHELEAFAHIGVLLLLFSVGLKLRFKALVRPEVWVSALGQTLLYAATVFPILYFGFALGSTQAILLGVALSFSSTVVAAKILEEKLELRSYHGRLAIGVLVVQDLIAVGCLSVLGDHGPSLWALALLGLPLLRPVLNRMLEVSGHSELLLVFGLIAALAGGHLFELTGLSSELGALIVGALFAGHPKAKEMSDSLWGLKETFLIGFFLMIGFEATPPSSGLGLLAILLVLLVPKAFAFFRLFVATGLTTRSGVLGGLALGNYSEFGLILVAAMVEANMLSAEWLGLVAVVVAISFTLSAPLNRRSHEIFPRIQPILQHYEHAEKHPDDEPLRLGSAEFLVMGMGRVGTGAYDFLAGHGMRVVGLDSDPSKVEKHRAKGRRVLFGDAEDAKLWENLPTSGLRSVLLTMADPDAHTFAARKLRMGGYTGQVAATSFHREDAEAMSAAGADLTVNLFIEAGSGFAEHVWETLHPHGEQLPPAKETATETQPA